MLYIEIFKEALRNDTVFSIKIRKIITFWQQEQCLLYCEKNIMFSVLEGAMSEIHTWNSSAIAT